ncbi:GNAT family N-acetyltransferase [Acidobacteria bacterium AH-259-D05]|nr:GNAT family N-acetyltransferase [Acidobacteria bacterium AH-259-D05]
MISITVATAEDIAQAKAIAKAAFSELRSVYSPTQTAIANQQDSTAYVVAKAGQTVVGTLQYFDEGERIYVFDVAVDPHYRRQGVARRLIAFVSDTARSLGHKTVLTRAIKETGNVEIFERLGFRVVGEETAKWCFSDRYSVLHDVYLERQVA